MSGMEIVIVSVEVLTLTVAVWGALQAVLVDSSMSEVCDE